VLNVPERVAQAGRCGITSEVICRLKERQVMNDETCGTRA
jgi:hypothetical protein